MITNSPKLLLLACLAFLGAVLLISFLRGSKDCDSERAQMSTLMGRFNNPESIKEIVLYKTYPGWKINLVKDTFIIRNDTIIRNLHSLILKRQVGSWSRLIATWNVTMKVQMHEGSSITWKVSRKESKEGLTYVAPLESDCFESHPSYSPSLGSYMEQITGFTGVKYE